ncbi:RagB/SusD family nutrient uptake outer membrane protein [Reichenbachiella versicolor]|uniref:RagB/SusD family nutrient uptake outer membrane protein n=1 Tax=Reichenbachiella versicolor TaxID=1821036 RepID=UPI000D6DE541|nr:RagB/SusD family nutrient uptake outer membrane protein [Reichenbachiella versicolor]
MNNTILKILTPVFTVISMMACEEFLDQENPNEVVAENFWKDLSETNETLTAVYGAMLNHYVHSKVASTLRSDLGVPKARLSSTVSVRLANWYDHTYNSSDIDIGRDWEAKYTVIARANQVIYALNSLPQEYVAANLDQWRIQMGQARFFRGLMHFYLHSTYNQGEIIIRDKIADLDDFDKEFASSENVIAFFREDLEYAYQNLPYQYSSNELNLGRVTKGAAAAMLGKSYLYQEEYAEAQVYLEDILENLSEYGYELVRDMDLMFTDAGEFNNESILEINYSIVREVDGDINDEESFINRWARHFAPANQAGGSEDITMAAWLVDAYQSEVMNPSDSRNIINEGDPSDPSDDELRPVSLRASAMAALVHDDITTYYQKVSTIATAKFNNGVVGYFKKLTNFDITSNEKLLAGETNQRSGKNVILCRLADVYLMQAECLAHTGPDMTRSLSLINEVRARWGLQLRGAGTIQEYDNLTYDKDMVMNAIMYEERPLELCLEGNNERVIDLRRWGVTKDRYKDLSTREYHIIDHTFNGRTEKARLQEGPASNSMNDSAEDIPADYVTAAKNYSVEGNGYWPIPIDESQSNSKL